MNPNGGSMGAEAMVTQEGNSDPSIMVSHGMPCAIIAEGLRLIRGFVVLSLFESKGTVMYSWLGCQEVGAAQVEPMPFRPERNQCRKDR